MIVRLSLIVLALITLSGAGCDGGSDGSSGKQGEAGVAGEVGEAGADGLDGRPGTSGKSVLMNFSEGDLTGQVLNQGSYTLLLDLQDQSSTTLDWADLTGVVTGMLVNDIDADGIDRHEYYEQIQPGHVTTLWVSDRKWVDWRITSIEYLDGKHAFGLAFVGKDDLDGIADLDATDAIQLQWSRAQDGAQGIAGVGGAQGLQGSQGDTGAQGSAGSDGARGIQGLPGMIGATGTDGTQGATGAAGMAGARGAAGSDGAQGSQGVAGNDGAQGPQGAAGSDGAQGLQGVAGSDGAQGATGATGAQGEQGEQGILGAIGEMGEQGLQGLEGLVGAIGEMGAQGIDGIMGAAGLDGEDGAQGDQGAQGDVGSNGIDGATGPAGPAGADGADGEDLDLSLIADIYEYMDAVELMLTTYIDGRFDLAWSAINANSFGRDENEENIQALTDTSLAIPFEEKEFGLPYSFQQLIMRADENELFISGYVNDVNAGDGNSFRVYIGLRNRVRDPNVIWTNGATWAIMLELRGADGGSSSFSAGEQIDLHRAYLNNDQPDPTSTPFSLTPIVREFGGFSSHPREWFELTIPMPWLIEQFGYVYLNAGVDPGDRLAVLGYYANTSADPVVFPAAVPFGSNLLDQLMDFSAYHSIQVH